MGEVKSALELALEKTKDLDFTEDEKKSWKKEESEKKAQSLINRYIADDLRLETLKKELAVSREGVEKKIIELAAKKVASFENVQKLLGLLEGLCRANEGASLIVEQLRRTVEALEAEISTAYRQTEAQLKTELAEAGIRGSSVIPNVQESALWKENENRVLKRQMRKLSLLAEELVKACESKNP